MKNILHALLLRRMVVKIFAALGLVVGATLLVLAWKQSDEEIAALNAETEDSAEKVADAMIGSIEHVMLQGDGVAVTDLVRAVKHRVPDAEIQIYDPRGGEVFGEKPPAPARASLPAELGTTLDDGRRRVAVGRILHPIANEARCHDCHEEKPLLRGVLALRIDDAATHAHRDEILGTLVRDAFVDVMTARKKDLLDDYFSDLIKTTPTIRGVAVYDRDGDVAFGAAIPGMSRETVVRALRPDAPRTDVPRDGGRVAVVPLPMQDRCVECHDKEPVRGVLVVSLDDLPTTLGSSQELESVIDTSLRVIMMSSLGRMITRYLDSVAVTGAATNLTLFDDAGRTYYSTDRPSPPPHVVEALATGRTAWAMTGSGSDERVRIVQPLLNGKGCVRCHGSESKLRGAVTVSLSTGRAAELRIVARRRAVVVMCVALATILALLYFLLGYLVIRPVRQIGDVAEAVGHGNLDVVVSRAAADGDEVSRLGRRVNDMIIGLRTELEMRRFVSKGTAKAARGAAGDPVANVAAAQSRRPATVLFTDIRGFTAYSETVSPERVVAMLNRLLQAQADVVERYGGDIDKYVGDELMAVFEGDDAEARAVRCAIEMIEAVDQQRTEGEAMRVGAGISRGEVVHGPIGSKNRQDFTVIGDVVNVGARLCSAADGGEVIVSGAVRAACESAPDIAFDQTDPLTLKGKREPFPAFRARRAR